MTEKKRKKGDTGAIGAGAAQGETGAVGAAGVADDDTSSILAIGAASRRGEHGLRFGMIVLVVGLGLLVLAATFQTLRILATPIGDYPVPQRVVIRTVEQGGDVIVRSTKCMDLPHTITGISFWVTVDGPFDRRPYSTGGAYREAGCRNFEYRNTLPADIPPGRWRLQGIDTAHVGPFTQDVVWYTEDFTVTEKADAR